MGQRVGAVEELGVMRLFGDAYRGKRVLLTGHTGFKGSWLALWLKELGAEVTGVALSPGSTPSHWDLLGLDVHDDRTDIRSAANLSKVVERTRPHVVFHLAAQAMVRRSYREPLETWSTNVMGTANLLEACRHVPDLQAIVVVTTDKCYENREWSWGYREIDALGGHDPYSASKAGAELVAASYRSSWFAKGGPLLATARAGNVIGGGDWSEDRLIPDLVRAVATRRALEIRSPMSTRPWQHVLESLSGYLLLGQRLMGGDAGCARAWNFGPEPDGNRSVSSVLETLAGVWPGISWRTTTESQPHEATLLYLDSSLARQKLQWRSVWDIDSALKATAQWYQNYLERGEVISRDQLRQYVDAAATLRVPWISR